MKMHYMTQLNQVKLLGVVVGAPVLALLSVRWSRTSMITALAVALAAVDHKVLELAEVIATPHLGASTYEAQENVAIDVSHDVVRILSGELARNPVNIPSVPREVMRKIEPYFDLSAKLGTFLAHSDMNGIESLTINY